MSSELVRLAFLYGSRVYCSPACVGDEIAGHDDAEPGDLKPDSNALMVRIPDEGADVVLTCARCGDELRWLR
jgi:hypothetical protein